MIEVIEIVLYAPALITTNQIINNHLLSCNGISAPYTIQTNGGHNSSSFFWKKWSQQDSCNVSWLILPKEKPNYFLLILGLLDMIPTSKKRTDVNLLFLWLREKTCLKFSPALKYNPARMFISTDRGKRKQLHQPCTPPAFPSTLVKIPRKSAMIRRHRLEKKTQQTRF